MLQMNQFALNPIGVVLSAQIVISVELNIPLVTNGGNVLLTTTIGID